MLVSFPAMQGVIGQKTYYSCLMKLAAIPKMFTFRDWVEFTPEDREQRVLNKTRVPEIARYITDNEDGYLFSSITASYKCKVNFRPVSEGASIGNLEMDFESANFVINDGQHRCAAIAAAIKDNPALGDESISVLLFEYESRARVQQMFSDLNRAVVKTSKSLDILYDHRDPMALVTLEVCDKVPVFHDQVDKDAVSLPARSPKLFSLSSIYDANKELLRGMLDSSSHHEMVSTATDFWIEVSKAIPAWTRVKRGELKAMDLRQASISSHSVVLRAIGGIGGELMRDNPENWKTSLTDLRTVDWAKSNKDWEFICIVAGSVVSNRQARLATKAYLKKHLGMRLTDPEIRCLPRTEGVESGIADPTSSEDIELDFLKDPDFTLARDDTDRFLFALSWACKKDPKAFSRVCSEIRGTQRQYFARSAAEIEATGNSMQARQIPGTEYWACTNKSSPEKKKIVERVLTEVLGLDEEKVSREMEPWFYPTERGRKSA